MQFLNFTKENEIEYCTNNSNYNGFGVNWYLSKRIESNCVTKVNYINTLNEFLDSFDWLELNFDKDNYFNSKEDWISYLSRVELSNDPIIGFPSFLFYLKLNYFDTTTGYHGNIRCLPANVTIEIGYKDLFFTQVIVFELRPDFFYKNINTIDSNVSLSNLAIEFNRSVLKKSLKNIENYHYAIETYPVLEGTKLYWGGIKSTKYGFNDIAKYERISNELLIIEYKRLKLDGRDLNEIENEFKVRSLNLPKKFSLY